jgi:uncharacterized repeat protein (TIGR03803 family)
MHALSDEHGSLMQIQATISLAVALCLGLAHDPARAGSGFRVLHTFTAEEGRALNGQLVEGADGRLYGTAEEGGERDKGTVFRATTGGKVKVLLSFIRGKTGEREPTSGLITGPGGLFYGTTPVGGDFGGSPGALYQVSPSGQKTVLHFFAGGANDASVPRSRPLLASDGNFYGTSLDGGAADEGVVYRMTPAGEVTVMHSVAGGRDDGTWPWGELIEASDGNFYGTTYWGGQKDAGTLFRMTPDGHVTLLHHFGVTAGDGIQPDAGLVQGSDGHLYGTTSWSDYDAGGRGALFRISLAGEYTLLHTFDDSDGSEPEAGLVRASNGNFYGSTMYGGAHSCGVLFRLSPEGAFKVLHHLDYTEGCNPKGALMQASDGYLYGTTRTTLFRLKAE